MLLRNILLFLGLVSLPIYLFESGVPQPSHFILSLYILAVASQQSLVIGKDGAFLIALFFIVLIRDGLAVTSSFDFEGVANPAYILFNLAVLLAFKTDMATNFESFCKVLLLGIYGALAVAVGGLVVQGVSFSGSADLSRSIGTFNNPNQLGYFSLCMASLTLLLMVTKNVSKALAGFLMLVALLLVVASLSKSALLAFMFAGLFYLYLLFPKGYELSMGSFLSLVAILITYVLFSIGTFDGFYAFERLMSIGTDTDDNLGVRGYLLFRYIDTPMELIFGLGYQQVIDLLHHEVHSTVASFFFNYGAVGGLLFLGFLLAWLIKLKQRFDILAMIAVAGPTMIYGLAHNGSRFTFFYILVAMSMTIPVRVRSRKRHLEQPLPAH